MIIHYHSGATLPSSAAKAVHVMKMCRAWAVRGHDVTLFGKGPKSVSNEDIFTRYGVEANFNLVRAANIPVPVISGVWRMMDNARTAKSMPTPDLVYGRDPIALALSTPKNVPVAFEAHQIFDSPTQVWAIKRLLKSPNFVGVVTISQALKDDFIKEYGGVRPNQVYVAHDGADLPDGKAEPIDLGGRRDALKLGYTGSLHEGKGAETLLQIAESLPECDIHICGGNPDQIAALKVGLKPQNIYFHGHIDHSVLPRYLAAFDILCAPYREKAMIKSGQDISRWISPMKLFEYMATGKPILCSDLPVIREILQDGENAILVPPSAIAAWCKAVKTLEQDRELQKRLARKAYNDLENHFTWSKRAEGIAAFCTQNS